MFTIFSTVFVARKFFFEKLQLKIIHLSWICHSFYKRRVNWNCLVSPFYTPFSKWYPGLLTLLVRLDWIRVNSYPNPTSWPGLSFTVYDLTLTNRIKRGFNLKKLSGFSNQHLHPSARNLLTKSFYSFTQREFYN